MHIPDAYLSPSTQLAADVVMLPIWAIAVRKTRATLTSKQVPLMSVGAAFCFAIQMFNIPALGGTTAHALGTVLVAILLGPWAAVLTMTLTLAVQALFFGDGGVLSLGANCFDMAVVPAFVGSWVYQLVSGRVGEVGVGRSGPGRPRYLAGSALAGFLGTAVASLSAGLILGLQPLIAHDSLGKALYFPFGWSVSVPSMVLIHLVTAAPAEAIITVSALAYLWKNFPDLATANRPIRVGSRLRLSKALVAVMVLTPLGLIAGGSAWGEWEPQAFKNMVGYVPAGITSSSALVHPLLPDYALPGGQGHFWEILGYLVSAAFGMTLVAAVTRGLVRKPAGHAPVVGTVQAPGRELPAWLASANPALPVAGKAGKQWIEPMVGRMRGAIEETVATERVARLPGFLQKMGSTPKAILALCGLVTIALLGQPLALAAVLALVLVSGAVSKVPMKPFVGRVLSAVAFFGLIVAAPLALRAVTPGAAIGSGPLALSDAGLKMALLMLLRLACGISLTLLWTQTTRWHDLIRGLRCLGMPAFFCSGITLAYRYLFVVMETLGEMVTARRSRQASRLNKDQARAYAGAGAAILFAKSYAFTEELHMAMRSRCFDREGGSGGARGWSRSEVVAVMAGVFVVLFLVSLKVIHVV